MKITPEVQAKALDLGISLAGDLTLAALLRRPELEYRPLMQLAGIDPEEDSAVYEQVEVQIKYEGYIERQAREINCARKLENAKIPNDFNYTVVKGFSREVLEKLVRFRPHSLGQASRLEGITPAAIGVLQVAVERFKRG
jgi:tRNA uridine 5-carboxymethylaminomethyl modification enzyme